MSALQPQRQTRGDGHACTDFDVEMIEELTLLFPLFRIYTQKKKAVRSLAYERSRPEELQKKSNF